MPIYRGSGGVNRNVAEIHRCLSGVNRNVKEQYRGLSGVNRKVFSKERVIYNYGTVESFVKHSNVSFIDEIGDFSNYPTAQYAYSTINASNVTFKFDPKGNNMGGMIPIDFSNPIDCSQYSRLYMTFNILEACWAYGIIILAKDLTYSFLNFYPNTKGILQDDAGYAQSGPNGVLATQDRTVSVDISAVTGNYYIVAGLYTRGITNGTATMVLKKIWLE